MNMVPIYTEGPSSRASKPLIKGDDTRSRDRATSMGRDEPLSQLWGRKCIYQSQAVADTPIHRVLRHKRGTCGGKSLVSVRSRGFPGGSVVKNLPANAGDTGLVPDLGRSQLKKRKKRKKNRSWPTWTFPLHEGLELFPVW